MSTLEVHNLDTKVHGFQPPKISKSTGRSPPFSIREVQVQVHLLVRPVNAHGLAAIGRFAPLPVCRSLTEVVATHARACGERSEQRWVRASGLKMPEKRAVSNDFDSDCQPILHLSRFETD